MVDRRVGVGRLEDLLLRCLVNADRLLLPVECVITASTSLLHFLSIDSCDGSVRFWLSQLCDRNSCRSVPSFLHLCSLNNAEVRNMH